MAHAFFVVNADCRVAYVDNAVSELLCRDHDLLEGRPCWKVIGLQTPEGKPFCGESCPVRTQVRDHPSNGQFGPVHLRVPDSLTTVQLIASPLHAPSTDGIVILHRLSFDSDLDGTNSANRRGRARDSRPAMSGTERVQSLTPRETEILRMTAIGGTTRDIAARLCISPITVRNHLRNVMHKLGVHRRLDAVLTWLDNPGSDRPRRRDVDA